MRSLPFTAIDVREMLSSLLLAETPYAQRIQWAQGASLPEDFALDAIAPDALSRIGQRADAMFHARTAGSLKGMRLEEWARAIAGHWNNSPENITFFTSGSTGEPVPATHPFAVHEQEITALAKQFRDRTRIVGFVPRHHIYGFLFSVLLPKALEIEVAWQQPMPTPGLISALRPGDLVIAFPLFWEKLVQLGTPVPEGVFGVTSTGPCPAAVIHALRENGLERMTEVYGSSETGGIGYRHEPSAAYTLLPHWNQTDDPGKLLRSMPNAPDREYPLQDHLIWEDHKRFRPAGRTDKAVQVAGINVYPKRVRETILGHPDVRECAVRLMRPEEGARLKALVVPRAESDPHRLEQELRVLAAKSLTQYERPGSWTFADRLPTNTMGKVADW
ncbi:AMP-binding enzyme [Salidesulfovibrio onnuriiensis]|uniref:AMP-binding enzyme n=1 Tax=Salidesulfovibrio onnuriiensis TaxID=2583823 RepID=UPI0011C884F4|nr:AMP-binding protein [Salidesulfovibrio onnuriiensis]